MLPTTPPSLSTPRVFISYSWTSDEHAARIRDLADRLTDAGINVVLDQYDLKKGQDLDTFMEQAVTDLTVTHVLALSDKRYAERADARTGGVGKETLILTPDVYKKAGQERVIPIALDRGEDGTLTLPVFLRGRDAIDMSRHEEHEERLEELIRVLYGKPRYAKPPLGTPPAYILDDNQLARPTRAKLRAYTDSINRGRDTAYANATDLLRAITDELATFQITAIPQDTPLDDLIVRRIKDTLPLRDDLLTYLNATAMHRPDERLTRLTGDLFECILDQQSVPLNTPSRGSQWDQYQFLQNEVFLYATAISIKHHRLDLLTSLTDRAYVPPPNYHFQRIDTLPYAVFSAHCESLDEDYNRRVHNNQRTSILADIIKERATHDTATFDDLVGADIVLFTKSIVVTRPDWYWYPRLLGYATHAGTPSLFRRAKFKTGFADLTTLFHVQNGDELRARFDEGAKRHRLNEWVLPRHVNFAGLIPLKEFDTQE